MKLFGYIAIAAAGILPALSSCAKQAEKPFPTPPPAAAATAPDKTKASGPPSPDESLPEGWVRAQKPAPGSVEARCGNYSMDEWSVAAADGAEGDGVKVTRYDWKQTREAELGKLPANVRAAVENSKDVRHVGNGATGYRVEQYGDGENGGGWLVGTDAGEWGGKLSWVSADGVVIKEVIDDNIRAIVKTRGGDIFVLSGMAHLSIDEGKFWKLEQDAQGSIRARALAELSSQPVGAVTKDADLLAVLHDKFVRLSPAGEVTVLNEIGLQWYYPNSIAQTRSGVIYLGGRLFLVRFVPENNGYREEWLAPQNCRKFSIDEKNLDCICRD